MFLSSYFMCSYQISRSLIHFELIFVMVLDSNSVSLFCKCYSVPNIISCRVFPSSTLYTQLLGHRLTVHIYICVYIYEEFIYIYVYIWVITWFSILIYWLVPCCFYFYHPKLWFKVVLRKFWSTLWNSHLLK